MANTKGNATLTFNYNNISFMVTKSLPHINQSDNGTTEPVDDSSEDLFSSFRFIKLFLYLLIFVLSVVGNTLVCAVMCRRRMRNVTNYFILNLAVADLSVTCICIPFDIPVQENGYIWPYGSTMCKVLYPLQTICLFASIFTLTSVSLTRYRAIVHPLLQQVTTSIALNVIVCIWLLSVILVSPYIMVLKYDVSSRQCLEVWPNLTQRQIYTASLFTLQYLLPLSVITVAYAKIGRALRKDVSTTNRSLQAAQLEDTKRVIRMLIIVTVIFAICVLPNNVMWMWLDFGQADQQFSRFWDLVTFSHTILFANSAANPICYTLCNEKFRREFASFLYSCCKFKALQHSATSSIGTHFTTNDMELRYKNPLLVTAMGTTTV